MAKIATATALSIEIDRILTSPYPVALQSLEEILRFDEDGNCFTTYAIANPCKIKELVFQVIDASITWPHIITILRQLSADPTFRRCVLQQAPGTLHSLLSQATDESNTKASTVCIQLLSDPLPPGIPLPSSAQQFFICVVKEAIGDPSASSLWQVHDLLTGACHQLPHILPEENWVSLQEELTHIVRSARTLQDQSVSLLCLGIIYALAVPSSLVTSLVPDIGPLHLTVQMKSDAAHDFFIGGKAHKSLNLAALQVTWCCKSNVGVTHNVALKLLGIAIDVFRVVDRGVLEQWSRGNEGDTNIRRMMSKLMEPGLDLELQLHLSALLATVADFYKLPHQAMTKIERVVVKAKSVQSKNQRISKSLSMVFAAFAVSSTLCIKNPQVQEMSVITKLNQHHLSDSVVTSLIQESLVAATPYSTIRSVTNLAILDLEIQLIANFALQHLTLQRRILATFTAISNEASLHNFLHQDLCCTDCGSGQYCDSILTERRRSLGSKLTSLFLKTILLNRSEMTSSLENVALLMLEKSCNLASQSFQCPDKLYRSANATSNAHLLSRGPFPLEVQAGGYWKDTIRAHVQAEASHRQNAMVQLLGDICQDLEQRCQSAEEPFRQEQQKTEKLQKEVSEAGRENSDLRGQLVERDMLLESLESTKTEAEERLRSVQLENEQLLISIDGLERVLREVSAATEAEIKRINDASEVKEIGLRAELAAKDSATADLESQIEQAERQSANLKVELVSSQHRVSELEDGYRILEVDLHAYAQKLELGNKSTMELETNLRKAQEDCETLSLALHDSKTRYDEACYRFDEQCSRHRSDLENVKIEIEQLESTNKVALQQLTAKFTAEEAVHVSQLKDALTRFDSVSEEVSRLRRTMEENEVTISHQLHQIAQLEDTVAEKEGKIEEFQAMRQTLAAALGQNVSDRKHTRKGVCYVKPVDAAQRSPNPLLRSTHSAAEMEVSQSTYEGQIEQGGRSSESTSSKGGPAPKRTNSRKTFKIPDIRPPKLNVATTRSVKLHERRLPLTDVSRGRGNMSPVRLNRFDQCSPAKRDGSKQNCSGDFEEEMNLEFGSEIIFTSTPFTPKAAELMDDADGIDDTTLDE